MDPFDETSLESEQHRPDTRLWNLNNIGPTRAFGIGTTSARYAPLEYAPLESEENRPDMPQWDSLSQCTLLSWIGRVNNACTCLWVFICGRKGHIIGSLEYVLGGGGERGRGSGRGRGRRRGRGRGRGRGVE